MFLKVKQILHEFLKNHLGWKTNRKIVVFESDDWGMTRMPSKNIYDELLQKGYSVDKCPYNKYDSLESNEDLEKLIAVLMSVKDSKGNPAKFTMNNIVANPDFDKIKDSGFEKYYYEPFNQTLKKYSNTNKVMQLYEEGLEKNVFKMQFHGREHVNINRWMKQLQDGNKDVLEAFNHKMYSLPKHNILSGRRNFLDSFGESDENFETVIRTGADIFYNIWGYDSDTFIAPCYTWSNKLEKTLKNINIKGIQGLTTQRIPIADSLFPKVKRKYNFIGKKNKEGQVYLIRNCIFEPIDKDHFSNLKSVLNQVDEAFKYGKPLIVCTHRANYIGRISSNNRDKNLKLLKQLLKYIVSKYEDVEFMSSDELVKLIQDEKY